MHTSIEEIIKKHLRNQKDNLITVLQEIQDEFGYISEESLIKVGEYLRMPASKIYGIATFYDQFRFEPKGKHHICICRGTACHVISSGTILREFEKQLKIKAGQTTRDGVFSLEVVQCVGACSLAPVISINGKFYSKITQTSIKEIIQECKQKEM
ncbi:MAG: NADH-quinone oxidoreductase subunit NuoE [Lentimicrobiaceae bacterium]|nr:NADH-quinone oxidoreductase subunit NuoE [Lentimicrobiaceae bacterium]